MATNPEDLILDSFAGFGTTGAIAQKMRKCWIISKEYDAGMLAEALCKLEGFTYAPSERKWWNRGYSTEQDYIYVTTQTLLVAQIEALIDEVSEDSSLLTSCRAFRCKADRFPNLTLKKIPKMVLSRCERGHDDYNLNVQNLPMAERDSYQDDLFGGDL